MTTKVLIIDDDPAITELIGLLLQSYGLQVISSNDSLRGLEMARTETPDVIILDLMMPGKSGWEICHEVRAFSRVPIAILSAIDDPAMIASTLDAGADDYLIKPVPSSELMAHINNLTRRANAEKGEAHTLLQKPGPYHFEQKPVQA
ncbi:MAG: hypothetical protein OHK0031_06800 [Anaerolineales bacterium]